MSIAAIRRLVVGVAGVQRPLSACRRRRRRSDDPPALRGPARLDLDRRPRAPADAPRAIGAFHARHGAAACCARAGSSSTGRTRRRCCRSSSGRTSARVMEGDGPLGPARSRAARRTRSSSSRCSSGSAPKGRSTSRDFEGQGRGGMWNWKPAKMVLDALWDNGVLVIAERRNFQRAYDLAERVIPKQWLDAPTPSEDETLRTFALLAVAARGALTEPAIREHWRLEGRQGAAAPSPARARRRRRLREVAVDDGGAPFYVLPDVRARRRPGAARARRPVRQPRLGPAAARAPLRLQARDRGLQARARARRTATTCCRCSPATGSSGAPT